MTDLAESLAEASVEVTALAGRGRYNGGGALPRREEYRGVKVERAWATSFGKASVPGRLSDYLSFYLGAAWKLLTLPRHDVVMALTTPPLISLLALLVCGLRGMRLVALVQDIYPDVGVALGTFKKGSILTRILEWLNVLVLRRADRIIVLGDCMREVVASKVGGDTSGRVDVIHNWADGRKICPLGANEENPFVGEYGLVGRFVVLFSGNFGKVNDFSTPLEAARLLKGRRDIVFLFVGDGARSEEINSFVSSYELDNVRLLPYQPRESLRYSLAAGDAHLVTLAPGLAGLSVPSKTYGILAAGRPVLYVGDHHSAVARLISEHGCGAVIPTSDGERLAEVIAGWVGRPESVAAMGRAARYLFEQRFDRPHAVGAYAESLRKCLDTGPRRGSRRGGVAALPRRN
jgi:glycosyltransferase involved in cell wall biosynthesis